MSDQKYNGWTNRETWVINLCLGDILQQVVTDYLEAYENTDEFEIAQHLETEFYSIYDEELNGLSGVLKDLIYVDSVNWLELAENYMED